MVTKEGWKLSTIALVALFLLCLFLMNLFEPEGSDLTKFPVYWWWFIVTATTVGYGDFAPASVGGRFAAVLVMIGGISAIGVVIGQVTSAWTTFTRRAMQGLAELDLNGHIVIFGYHPGKTEQIVGEILADRHREERDLVLCFDPDQAQENPLPESVKAVRGKLSSNDVLRRACINQASRVIVDGHGDNETLVIAVAVVHENEQAHVVVALHDLEGYSENCQRVSRSIECVPSGMVTMIVQALQDPGIIRLYGNLLSNLRGHEGYRLDVPGVFSKVQYIDLLVRLKQEHNATLIGMAQSHESHAEVRENPDPNFEVCGGMSLYYIAPRRITEIDWSAIAPATA